METVSVDMNGDKAIVTGQIEPEKILKRLRKKTGKKVEIIKKNDDNGEGNKDETFRPSRDCNMEIMDTIVLSGNFVENVVVDFNMFSDENPNACSIT